VYLLARNEEINRWLDEHPLVLGGGAAVIGLILAAYGVSALMTGKATDKWGRELQGGHAQFMGIIWLVFGAICLLFGGYKILVGLL